MAASSVEQQVQAAIQRASRQTGVPASVLQWIHDHEVTISREGPLQGTTTNPQGYGGFFGLPASDFSGGDPYRQALTTAKLLQGYNQPTWQAAINEYNTGSPTRGYGSGYGGGGAPVPSSVPTDLGGSSIYQSPGRPGSTGGNSFWGSIWGDVSGTASGAFGAVEGGAESAIGSSLGFLKAALWLLNPVTWLRAVETAFGFVLILAGIAIMVNLPDRITTALGPVAGAAEAVAPEA